MPKGIFTPNRRNYPKHVDGLGFYPDMESVSRELSDVLGRGTESGAEVLNREGSLGERADVHAMFHKVKASFNDPMSVYFVLDAMVNSQRGIYLRPVYVTGFLRDYVGQFYWSPGVVGRIMAGLSGAAVATYLDDPPPNAYILTHDSTGEPIERSEQLKTLPLSEGRDGRGRYFVLDPQGGNEGLLWCLLARKVFLRLARSSMADDEVGRQGANWGGENSAADYYSSLIARPARLPVAYRNQLQSAAPWPGRTAEASRMQFNGS